MSIMQKEKRRFGPAPDPVDMEPGSDGVWRTARTGSPTGRSQKPKGAAFGWLVLLIGGTFTTAIVFAFLPFFSVFVAGSLFRLTFLERPDAQPGSALLNLMALALWAAAWPFVGGVLAYGATWWLTGDAFPTITWLFGLFD